MHAALLLAVAAFSADAEPRATVLIVVGAEGTEEYGQQFRSWAARWQAAAERGNAECVTIGIDELGEKSDRELFEKRIVEQATSSPLPLSAAVAGIDRPWHVRRQDGAVQPARAGRDAR
jgi:hypothetical protein